MRIAKIADTLRAQGHAVTIYKRPDGGYRITKIDGIKFDVSGNAGNDYARGLLGESLSQKQYTQRRKAQPLAQEGKQATRITSFKWRKSKVSPSKSVKETIRKKGPRYQSLTPRKGDTPEEREQKIKIRRLRRRLKARGVETDTKILRKRLRYSPLRDVASVLANKSRKQAGLAYAKNVDALADFVDVVASFSPDEGAVEFASALRENLADMRSCMMDHTITDVNKELYELQKQLKDGSAIDWGTAYERIRSMLADGYDEALKTAEEWGIDIDND